MFGMFDQELYKFYQLAIALQFLKMSDKKLVQSEKDRFIEFANKLELDVKFDDFEELTTIVKFKINEMHKDKDFFKAASLSHIIELIDAGNFNKLEITNIIWTLINLAYADGKFSDDEDGAINEIAKNTQSKKVSFWR